MWHRQTHSMVSTYSILAGRNAVWCDVYGIFGRRRSETKRVEYLFLLSFRGFLYNTQVRCTHKFHYSFGSLIRICRRRDFVYSTNYFWIWTVLKTGQCQTDLDNQVFNFNLSNLILSLTKREELSLRHQLLFMRPNVLDTASYCYLSGTQMELVQYDM